MLTRNISHILLGAVVLITVLGGVAWAAPLYEEHFENGAGFDNYPDWDLGGQHDEPPQVVGDAVVDVMDSGGGDFAIMTGANEPDRQHRVQLTIPFERGNNVRVTFKVWGDSSQSWDGAMFPTGAGIVGPWHIDSDSPPFRKMNDDVGAGVNWWNGIFGDARWEEGGLTEGPDVNSGTVCGGCGTLTGPIVDTAFTDAFFTADGKENCIWIRVWLGDAQGGKLEWSTNGLTWNDITSRGGNTGGQVDGEAGVLLDSRPPGYDPPQNDQDSDGDGLGYKQVPGTESPLFIAFGTAPTTRAAGTVFFDDIVVEDDNNTQGPTGPSIYFVSAGTAAAPHESEVLLIDRLQSVLGYNVNVVNELDQNVADALTHDLIFISASGSSSNTAPFIEEYRKSDVPFLMSELGVLVTGLFGPDAVGAGTSDVQNMKVLDNNHFITENFSVGEIVEVRTSSDGLLVQINPGMSEATILAAANDGNDTQGTIVAMEVGDEFEDGVPTTARRAFFFLHASHIYLENYTLAGVELVDRVFQWALMEPPSPNPVDQQLWTFFE